MHIDMKNPKGIKLKTEGKYCAENIDVVPTLEEVIVDPTDTEQIVEPSANYAGIKKVTVRAAGGGGMTYSVVEITTSQTKLTNEQYNTLIASPFNKIKRNNVVYNLYQEDTAQLVYTANYFNNGDRITIVKSSKNISSGSLNSLTNISPYVKNNLDYSSSNNTYALSAYQGKVLNDRLTALENSGLPFISFGSTQTTYPITGEFTEEQANKLRSAPFSTITFSPGGSTDSISMLPQTSEQSHYSYIWKGSDDTYDYTVTATIQPATSPATGWISKSYTITRNTKSTSTNDVTPVFSIVLPKDVIFPYTGTLTDEQKALLITVPTRSQVIDVQIGATNDQLDYNTHYLCSNDFINAQHGAYGSTYWAQYDDTKKIKVKFDYNTFTNKTYTISLVEASGGGTVTFPTVDLTNATVPGSGDFTDEEANLIYSVNNNASFIMIQDTKKNGRAIYIVLPLVYVDSVHSQYIYESTVCGNTYTLEAAMMKTTGGIWGMKAYTITKAAAEKAKLYQHTLAFRYSVTSGNTTTVYDTYIPLINSYSGEMSVTPFLNTYGTDPVWGYWGAYRNTTGTIASTIIKIAATSQGFRLTISTMTEVEGTLISDTVKEV